MGNCEETAGFLFKHECGREATENCADCSKPVCGRHLKTVEGAQVCVACAQALLAKGDDKTRQRYREDPYFYGMSHYDGYGSYRRGQWGHGYYSRSRHDTSDFTEADGAAFAAEGDEGWETDMGAS